MKKTYRTLMVTDTEGRPSLFTIGQDGQPDRQFHTLRTIMAEFRLTGGALPVTITADDGRDDLFRFDPEAYSMVESGKVRGRVTDGENAEVTVIEMQLRSPGFPVAAKVFDGSEDRLRTYSAGGVCSDGNPDHDLVIMIERQDSRQEEQRKAEDAPKTAAEPEVVIISEPAPQQEPQAPAYAGLTPAQAVRDIISRYGPGEKPLTTVMNHRDEWKDTFSDQQMASAVMRLDALQRQKSGS